MRRSIVGKVFSGVGRGCFFVSLEGYKSQLTDLLGGEPFYGTLNLRVNPAEAGKFLGGLEMRELAGFVEKGHRYGKLKVTKIVVGGLKSFIVIPEKTHYDKNTLEIISKYNLREKLGLADGDEVTVLGSHVIARST